LLRSGRQYDVSPAAARNFAQQLKQLSLRLREVTGAVNIQEVTGAVNNQGLNSRNLAGFKPLTKVDQ